MILNVKYNKKKRYWYTNITCRFNDFISLRLNWGGNTVCLMIK